MVSILWTPFKTGSVLKVASACHWPGSLGKAFSACLQNCLGSTLSPQMFLPIKEKSLLLVTSPVKISLIVSWCSGLCIFVSKDTFLGDVMKSPKTQRGCVGLGKTLCWGLICECQKEKKGSRHLGKCPPSRTFGLATVVEEIKNTWKLEGASGSQEDWS